MAIELKPCPFCGGKAYQPNPDQAHGGMVCCQNCGAEAFGPKWNLRQLDEAGAQSGDVCPDCKRGKAKNVADAAAGLCPKWWAVRDEMADQDCARHASTLTPQPEGEAKAVADIVPEGCTGSSLVFSEGVLHVKKDGSGYIVVKEPDFEIETEYDSEDGSRSDFWITRFPPGEMQTLRDFLNGVRFTTPPPPVVDERPAAWEVRGAQLHRVLFDEAEARELASGFKGAVTPLYRAAIGATNG